MRIKILFEEDYFCAVENYCVYNICHVTFLRRNPAFVINSLTLNLNFNVMYW